MKIETLAKRIGEKTNCPELEQALLGKISYMDLPEGCLIWTGSVSNFKNRPRVKLCRTHTKQVNVRVVLEPQRAQIKFEGRRQYVQRIVFKMLIKPDVDFRLINTCGNTLCVSPTHWSPRFSEILIPVDEIPDSIFDLTEEEADTLVELMLAHETCPSNWDEVLVHVYMEDVPPKMIEEMLQEKRKFHLLPHD
jgi:hypothetical protein